jgi:hypothetical protein
MPRNDPTDTGGLFIGRRPGTRPLKYRALPEREKKRMRVDSALAALVLLFEILIVLSVWGPQPLAWLWVGSQVAYHSGSLMLGIVSAFLGLLLSLMATLAITSRVDGLWRILRRAAGHDQREGALPRIFLWSAIVVGAAFTFWFVFIEGPGPAIAPRQ